MSKKNQNTSSQEETNSETPGEQLQLFVGVNFVADGDTEETRIESGLINLGILPAAFQDELIQKGKAKIRLN